MPLDFDRLFPMKDVPSARLMKLKAFCLFRAGVLSEQMNEICVKARMDGLIRTRFPLRAAPPPRRLISRHASQLRYGTAPRLSVCRGTTGFAPCCHIVFPPSPSSRHRPLETSMWMSKNALLSILVACWIVGLLNRFHSWDTTLHYLVLSMLIVAIMAAKRQYSLRYAKNRISRRR